MSKKYSFLIVLILLFSCKTESKKETGINQIAKINTGWQGEVIAESTESYFGWDVEIGDADNDGKNEVLATGCPSSALYISKLKDDVWNTKLMKDNLAKTFPGMGLTVKVTDLNRDGINEIILGTGQEGENNPPFFYTFQIKNNTLKTLNVSHPYDINKSSYTHNLAFYDLNNDGILEVISSYCGGGEILRYDFSKDLKSVNARKIYQLSGSGEETLIVDVDNDGEMELIVSNGFRKEAARVEIFEFDNNGELVKTPRVVIDNYDGKKCFYASITIGDVDNDGENEMIIGWKQNQKINKGTIVGYKITDKVTTKYTFAYDDEALDMSYFEKMMVIADADNDGKNELVVSTRGDNQSEKIGSNHLGHIFMYSIQPDETVTSELIVDLNKEYAESSWIDVGDADNDGKNEIVIATGKGDRTKKGKSYLLLVKKKTD